MYQYEYQNNNEPENNKNINYDTKINPISEQSDKLSSTFSKLEHDIYSLINFLRKNPLEFCNNLIQKNKYKTNQEQNEIINFLQDIHSKKILKPFIETQELSLAAKSLLNRIILHYKNNHSLNLKELEPTKKNLRARLSKYGERTGKIFETVLFELDNPDEIINHILREEKGRNMLLSQEMKFIGVSCDLIDTNLLCTVIDVVQDFIPFKNSNNKNNINNNINNNIYMMYNNNENNNYNFNKSNYNKLKPTYFYNQSNYTNTNSDYLSLIENLNSKNNKDNLKLKIMPRKKVADLPMNIKMDINLNDNYNLTNNNIQINLNEGKNRYYKTPTKIQILDYSKNNNFFSPNMINNNINNEKNFNFKKSMPKRMNSSNINTLKKDLNEENKNDINDIKDKDIKFTLAGRTDIEQQNIIENSKKNMNKSKSVCSFDAMSVNSKNGGKNKFQRLNHEEKMEILHKINNRNMKTPNSKSPTSENISENININLNQKKKIYEMHNKINKKTPSRIGYLDYFDIYSETEKNNPYIYNYNKKISKTTKGIEKNRKQEETEINNYEYSKKKINEIKNDLKIQLKEEIKKEVKDEIRDEFNNNNKILYEKKQINEPIYLNLDKNYNIANNIKQNTEYIPENKKIKSNNFNITNNNNKNKNNNNINDKIYYNKNKNNTRWSSSEKYYYINKQKTDLKNNKNKNLYIPKSPYNKKNKNIYYKGRKSFDWREFVPKNKNNDVILLKQKYQERYTKSNIPSKNIYSNNNTDDNFIDNTNRKTYINSKQNNKNIKIDDKKENNSYLNQIFQPTSKKEIKKLIKMYNMAQEDKRSKNSNMNNSSSYNIINNNKSINECLFNDNEILSDIIKVNFDDKKSNLNITENNKEDISQINNNKSTVKNIIITNNQIKNMKKMKKKKINKNNNFVEGHRFQIKYEKVKSKSQIYKDIIPQKRKFSMNNININIDKNIINNINMDNKSFIFNSSSPRSCDINRNEDIVNINNSNISNKNIIVKEKKEEEINNINNNLMKTGRFVDDDLINNDEIIGDIKNYMDENASYRELNEKPIISKIEKIEGNSVITTIITRTKKIYTPDKENHRPNKDNKSENNEKQIPINIFNNNKIMECFNDFDCSMNDTRSVTNQKNNSIKTKNISLSMNNTLDKQYKNNSCKTPNNKQITPTDINNISEFDLFSDISNNSDFEKKYIKDPEGNLVETLVKKTKYNNGSVLYEYV